MLPQQRMTLRLIGMICVLTHWSCQRGDADTRGVVSGDELVEIPTRHYDRRGQQVCSEPGNQRRACSRRDHSDWAIFMKGARVPRSLLTQHDQLAAAFVEESVRQVAYCASASPGDYYSAFKKRSGRESTAGNCANDDRLKEIVQQRNLNTVTRPGLGRCTLRR